MTALLSAYNVWHFVVEVTLIFIAIYGILYYMRGTKSSLIIAGLVFGYFCLYAVANFFELEVITHLLKLLGNSFMLVLLVIFQPEIRRALAQLGSYFSLNWKRRRELVSEVVIAAQDMAARKCGALIVLERKHPLKNLIDDAIPLDCKLSAVLLESIFYPNSPLHDGAVIIRDDRIVAARVILPLTRAENISKHLGTRHRAALGASEEYDAVTVIVSEQSGSIGLTCNGEFYRDLSGDELSNLLTSMMLRQQDEEETSETAALNAIEEDAKNDEELK